MAIENAQRYTRESPTVERFNTQQAIPARVARGPRAANDTLPNNAREVANDDAREQSFMETIGLGDRNESQNSHTKRVGGTHKKFPVSIFLSLTSFCSFWQFIFGLMAIVFIVVGAYETGFFGLTGDDIATFASTAVGGVVVAGANLVGSLFGFHIAIPPITFTTIGLMSWGITLVFTLIGYGGILGYLYFQAKSSSEDSHSWWIITAVVLDVCPITQLFPWMIMLIFALQFEQVSSKADIGF